MNWESGFIRIWWSNSMGRKHAPRAPEYAYPFAKELLSRNRAFTALFAFNDNSAIAAISAFQDVGLRVPEKCFGN